MNKMSFATRVTILSQCLLHSMVICKDRQNSLSYINNQLSKTPRDHSRGSSHYLYLWSRALQSRLECGKKLVELLIGRQVGVVGLYLFGAAEEESRFARTNHGEVVKRVPGRDGVEAHGL